MNRAVLAAFVIFQIAGEIATWMGSNPSSRGGPWLWVMSVIFLLPGDIAASWLIENLLWTSSWSLHQLQWFKMPCEIIINFIVWVLLAMFLTRINRTLKKKHAT
jgi:hypothetical protein